MKRFYICILLIFSYGAASAQAGYTVEGRIEGYGGRVYLAVDGIARDSVTAADGFFRFEGTLPQPRHATIMVNGRRAGELFLETGTIVFPGIDTTRRRNLAYGTQLNDRYSRYLTQRDAYFDSIYGLDATDETIDRMINNTRQLQLEMMRSNRGNALGAYIFARRIAHDINEFNLHKELEQFEPSILSHDYFDEVRQILAAKQQEYPGDRYRRVCLPGPDGRLIELSDIVGKGRYVLLDFWATWCGPCMGEMPTLVEAYEKYNGKGFEIYSIALNKVPERWLEEIERYGMRWINVLGSDAWRSDAVRDYGVIGIPSCFLISPGGTIIDTDLRGEELLRKLAEIYGE